MEDTDCLAVDNLVRLFIALFYDKGYADAVSDANLTEDFLRAKLIRDGIVHDCRGAGCKDVPREAICRCNAKSIQIRLIQAKGWALSDEVICLRIMDHQKTLCALNNHPDSGHQPSQRLFNLVDLRGRLR